LIVNSEIRHFYKQHKNGIVSLGVHFDCVGMKLVSHGGIIRPHFKNNKREAAIEEGTEKLTFLNS
jgi:hypothetical protein